MPKSQGRNCSRNLGEVGVPGHAICNNLQVGVSVRILWEGGGSASRMCRTGWPHPHPRPLPSRERESLQRGDWGVVRVGFTLTPALCLRGPPSREREQTLPSEGLRGIEA